MATATSRMSLDPPPSLMDLPHHGRLADLAPAVHAQVHRVSADAQNPGRASPSPRISRRTPVPFLLEAFPAPPSHIPGTPTSATPTSLLNSPSLLASTTSWLPPASAVSVVTVNSSDSIVVSSLCSPKSVAASLPPSNPPPSSPPTGPLPPVPGSSSFSPELFAAHRAFQAGVRSASPALTMTEPQWSQSRIEQRPRPSADVNEPVRGRGRQGSLSSLRNPIYPVNQQDAAIAEEPVEESCAPPPPPLGTPSSPPLFGSVAERKSQDRSRGDSPDILRSSLRRVAAGSRSSPDDKLFVEDSIASVDMSDLNALKSDNEGDGDDQASRAFPQYPPLPRSQPQSPIDPTPPAPSYIHSRRKPSGSFVSSTQGVTCLVDAATRHGAMSPEITQMITATPRPRKRSTPSCSRNPSASRDRKESSSRSRRGVDTAPVQTSAQGSTATLTTRAPRRGGDNRAHYARGEEEENDSDSSLDLHTPLPQLMLRHGMLSPNSKLLPSPDSDMTRLSIMSCLSTSSNVTNTSNLSLMSSASTSSKHPKDARDTMQRRHRHRDGRLLKGGVGLTTGLGWSDSEDEDAPSLLTRRVSTLVLSRRASSTSVASFRSAPSLPNPPPSLSRCISHSVLRESDEAEGEHHPDEFGYAHRSSLATRSLPSRSKPITRVGSVRSAGSSLGRYSTYSTSSAASGHHTRTGSASESSTYAASISPRPDGINSEHLMPGIREHDDGATPTRTAFGRSSFGSSGGGGADPHTPSSTASSASLPFPATPESTEPIAPPQSPYNQDKVLPPLPAAARSKYSTFVSRTVALSRPRTFSNTSSVSNGPATDTKTVPASTPRQSLANRPPKASIPAVPRPLNGPPRPSLTIPKPHLAPLSTASGLPRPTTPSLSSPNSSQGYTPRPLRLVSRTSSMPSSANPSQAETTSKTLQPGELPPRPGQVLTYNRHVHDQLKLRALSLNTGPNRAPGPLVSPGGAQTLFIPPTPSIGSTPTSLSTPVTDRSQSPMSASSPGGESPRPRPRTGTGMMYRNNLTVGSAATSRIRIPSTVSR